jgi:hypothetical protein
MKAYEHKVMVSAGFTINSPNPDPDHAELIRLIMDELDNCGPDDINYELDGPPTLTDSSEYTDCETV